MELEEGAEIDIPEKAGFVSHAAVADDERDEEEPLTVHGVALGEGLAFGDTDDSEEDGPTYYSPDVLEASAEMLKGRKIVDDTDHDNKEAFEPPNEAIVGEVTKTAYKDGVGVVYEGEVDREPEKSLIQNGRVDVSPAVFRSADDHDDDLGGKPAKRIGHWRDLAVVSEGGSPDASIATGPSEALQAEALAATFKPELLSTQTTAHTPSYEGTARQNWSMPSMADFESDDLGDIDNHYLVSKSGFPPEKFDDLRLPVVSPSGKLHLQALREMKSHAPQVTGLSGNILERVMTQIDNLAEGEFDVEFGENPTGETHARARNGTKSNSGEESGETMSMSESGQGGDGDGSGSGTGAENGSDEENGEEQNGNNELESMSKEDLVALVKELREDKASMRETLAELKGQVKALGGDVESLKAYMGPLEDQAVEAFSEEKSISEDMAREKFTTAEMMEELSEPDTVGEALGLTADPQTGEADSSGGGGMGSLTSDEESQIEDLSARAETFDNIDTDHAETLRQQAADVAGVEEFEDLEGEVV